MFIYLIINYQVLFLVSGVSPFFIFITKKDSINGWMNDPKDVMLRWMDLNVKKGVHSLTQSGGFSSKLSPWKMRIKHLGGPASVKRW